MKTQIIHGIKTGPSISINVPARGANTARKVKERYPNVNTVSDSLQAVHIDVKTVDQRSATPQEFTDCAFARAAKRCLKADGAYIGIKTSYLIFGNHAIRFFTPVSVQREIPSFDRHDDFAKGNYRLSPVSPSQRLGSAGGHRKPRNKFKPKRKGAFIPLHNGTARIRSEDERMAA